MKDERFMNEDDISFFPDSVKYFINFNLQKSIIKIFEYNICIVKF